MRVCYFGIYDPCFGRNAIYIKGLRQLGHTVIECRDVSPGIRKIFGLWKKHQKIKDKYDVLIVGYPGHIIVPFAKLIATKRVVADVLGSLYDAEIHSHRPSTVKGMRAFVADWLMVVFADVVLLESRTQKRFFERKFGRRNTYKVVYTGADDIFDCADRRPERKEVFTVLFKGSITPEGGIFSLLHIAESMQGRKEIVFRILGRGNMLETARAFVHEKKLPNVIFHTAFLPFADMIREMRTCDVMVGQFSDNPRLDRTIPHKAFEAIAMGIPYITARTGATNEIFVGGENCLMIERDDMDALREAILLLQRDVSLAQKLSRNGSLLYKNRFSPHVLARDLLEACDLS